MNRAVQRVAAAAAVGLPLLASLGDGGTTSTIGLAWHALALLGAGVAAQAVVTKPPVALPLPIALLVVWAGLGAVRAADGYAAQQAIWLAVVYASAYAAGTCLDASRPGAWVWWWRGAAAVHGVLAVVQWAALDLTRPASTFLNPNHLAGWLAVMIVVGWAHLPGQGMPRWLAIGSSIPGIAAIALTGSRGGQLAFLAGVAVLVVPRIVRLRRRGMAASRPLLGAVLAIFVLTTLLGLSQWRRLSEDDPFRWQRLAIWKASARVALEHPLWGAGPGQFPVVATRYQFPDDRGPLRHDRAFSTTHSDVLRPATELGVIGALLWVLLAGWVAAPLWRRPLDRLAAVRAGVCAAAVHGLVDNPSHWPAMALAVVVLLGAARRAAAEWGATPRRSPGGSAPMLPPWGSSGWRWGVALLLLAGFLKCDVAPTLGEWSLPGRGPGISIDLAKPPSHEPDRPLEVRESDRAAVRRAYLQAARWSPQRADLWKGLAELTFEGDVAVDEALYAQARVYLDRAIQASPQDFRPHWARARMEGRACLARYRDRASRDRALAAFERAQALAPADPRISIDAGQFALAAGAADQARRLAERALRREPNAVPAHLLLARSLLAGPQPDFVAAQASLSEARRLAGSLTPPPGGAMYAAEMLRLDPGQVARLERMLAAAPAGESVGHG